MVRTDKTVIVLGVIFVVMVLLLVPFNHKQTIEPNPGWQSDYRATLTSSGVSGYYTRDTTYFDYNSVAIQRAVDEIQATALNEEQAVQLAAEYVYQHIQYDYYESDWSCLNKQASKILEGGTGQCDTQTRALVAILRGLGFASTPVAGCIGMSTSCKRQQAFVGARMPIYQELAPEDLYDANYSRGAESRKGGLHTWTRVYMTNKGWVDIESTSGQFADSTCANYVEEYIPQSIRQECLSDNRSFAQMCGRL